MTRFINQEDRVVTASLEGLQRSGRVRDVAQLDGFPDIKVLFRLDHVKRHVAIISGGGAGHEPAHAAYVGQGMLTAAVSGEIFASPSVDAVLAAILTVTGEGGCLLIVKNYTGDRLNFGLAAERARQMGLDVDMVIIGDDVALPDAPQPRGIAGTVLAHKLAGFLSESGKPLAEIKQALVRLTQRMGSIGISLRTCELPGQRSRPERGMPELGLGIHGEPGRESLEVDSAAHAVALVTSRLEGHFRGQGKLVLMLNNLGSVTPLEMDILCRDVLDSRLGQRCSRLIGPASLLTSLNMYGFSLTVAASSPELEAALEYPVAPRAWPGSLSPATPMTVALPDKLIPPAWPAQADTAMQTLVTGLCDALIENRQRLDEMDAHVGDGDTGSTVAHGAEAVLEAMSNEGLPLRTPSALFDAIGRVIARSMGGSSGVLLSTFFTASGHALASGLTMAQALDQGMAAVQTYGGAKPGDRTMLDALAPAIRALQQSGDRHRAAEAAREGADQTRTMTTAAAGRSSYLRADSLTGHGDPGAEAVAIAFRALADIG